MQIRFAHLVLFIVVILVTGILILPRPKQRALWQARDSNLYRVIERFERSLEERPGDADLSNEMANYMIEVTSFDRAVPILEKQIESKKGVMRASEILYRYYLRIGDPHKALIHMMEVSKRNPRNYDLLDKVISQAHWVQDYKRLAEHLEGRFKNKDKLRPDDVDVLAKTYEILGELEKAVIWRRRQALRDKTSTEPWMRMIELFTLMGREDEEIRARNRLWRQTGKVEHGMEYAYRVQETGNLKELKKLQRSLYKAHNDDRDVMRMVFNISMATGDRRVDKYAREYLKMWPEDIEVLMDYGLFLANEGKAKDEFSPYFLNAIQLMGSVTADDVNYQKKAEALVHMEEYEDALAMWTVLMDKEPVLARSNMITVLRKMDRHDEALKYFRQLIAMAPNRELYLDYAFYLAELNMRNEAMEEWKKFTEDYGPDLSVLGSLVFSLLEDNEIAAARVYLNLLWDNFPEEKEPRYLKARFLHMDGENDKALPLLKKLLEEGEETLALSLYVDVLIALENNEDLLKVVDQLLKKEKIDQDMSRLAFYVMSLLKDERIDSFVVTHIDSWPDDFIVLMDYGVYLHENEKQDEAIPYFEKALMSIQGFLGGANERMREARLLDYLGRADEAIDKMKLLVDEKPEESQASLFDMYMKLNRLKDAAIVAKDLVERFPNKERRLNYVYLLGDLGRSKDALAQWKILLEKYPEDLEILTGTVYAHLTARNYEKALKLVEVLETHFPDDPESKLARARCYQYSGRSAKALELVEELARDDALGGEVPFHAEILISLGRVEEARRVLAPLRSKSRNDATASRLFISTSLATNDPKIDEDVRYHLSQWPDDVAVMVEYAQWLLPRPGREADARKLFVRALALLEKDPPETVEGLRLQASCYMGLGRYVEAAEFWNRLMVDQPVDARLGLIDALTSLKKFEEAEKVYLDLIEIQPTRDILVGYAYLLAEMGRLDEASRKWQELVKEFPDDAEILAGAVNNFLDRGEIQKASEVVESLNKYLDIPACRIALARYRQETGFSELALELLEELEKTGQLGEAGTFYADVLISNGQWQKALTIYANSISGGNAWWVHRDLAEIYQQRIDSVARFTRSSGNQKSREFTTTYNFRHGPEWAFEIGHKYDMHDRIDGDPVSRLHSRVPQYWLDTTRVLNRHHALASRVTLFQNNHRLSTGLSLRHHYTGRRDRTITTLGFGEYTSNPVELTDLDGKQDSLLFEGEHETALPRIGIFEGLDFSRVSVARSLSRSVGKEHLGNRSNWYLGARATLNELVVDEMPQFTLSYQFTHTQFSLASREVLNLVPFLEKQNDHSLSLDGFHRWGEYWEWQGGLGTNLDNTRGVSSLTFSSRFRFRTEEHWRFGLGYNFSSEAASAAGGITSTWELDLQGKW